MTLNQAVDKMRGAVNTSVTLSILRGANKDKQDIKLTRADVEQFAACFLGRHFFGTDGAADHPSICTRRGPGVSAQCGVA